MIIAIRIEISNLNQTWLILQGSVYNDYGKWQAFLNDYELVASDTRTLNALLTHTLNVVDFSAVVIDTFLYCSVL